MPKQPKLVEQTSKSHGVESSDFFATGVVHVKLSSEIVSANDIAISLLGFPEDFNFRGKCFLELCPSIGTESWAILLENLEEYQSCEFGAVFQNYIGDYQELGCLAVFEVGASVIDIYLSNQQEDDEKYSALVKKLEICESFFQTDLMDINIKNTHSEYEITSGLFEKTFSLDKGQGIGKTPYDIYPPKFADHVASHDKMVLERKQVVTQMDVVPYSGKHLLVQKFPLFHNNIVSGIGVFAVDVTSLKDSERRLIDTKNKFSDYFDLSEDILWEADGNWRLRESNIVEVANISGIELKNGEDFLGSLKSYLVEPWELDLFIESLERSRIQKQIFELYNGIRIRLGIKVCILDSDVDSTETAVKTDELRFYRGIITVLREN